MVNRLSLSGLTGLIVFLFFFFGNPVSAQTHTPKTVAISARCGGYYEYLPVNYLTNTSQTYPIIFYIHGGASYGNGSTASLALMLQNEGIPYYINQNLFPATFPLNSGTTSFIVISPQFNSEPSPSELKQVIDYFLAQNYRIDPLRIYITGYSVGGGVTWRAPSSLVAATRFAAMVPVAGYLNPYVDTTAQYIAAANLPVWAIHSISDERTPYSTSLNLVTKINSFGPPVPAIITQLASGILHDSTVRVAYNPAFRPNGKNIYEWMLQYSRNYPPQVNAGAAQSITLPASSVSLSGSATDQDGTVVSYAWSQVSGTPATITTATQSATTVTGLNTMGVRVFRLTATDNQGGVGSNDVTITVNNQPGNQLPVVSAGGTQTVTLPANSTTLNGTASDPDGSIVKYTWNQVSGTAANIASPSTASTSITGLTTAGTRVFRLTVTDNAGGISSSDVTINVVLAGKPVPGHIEAESYDAMNGIQTENTLDAGGGQNIGWIDNGDWMDYIVNVFSTASYTIIFRVATPNSGRTLQIKNASGTVLANVAIPLTNGWQTWTTVSTTLTLNAGVQTLRIYSNSTGWNFNWVDFNATGNIAPVASAGPAQSITLPLNTVTLSGSGTDPDGTIATYLWTQQSGPVTATLTSASTASTQVNGLNIAGTYVFRLLVTDNQGATGFNDVTITVSAPNVPPVANAGGNKTITLPASSVTLTGSGTDTDGTIVSYSWTQQSGTAATISSPSSATTNITGLTSSGIRVFRLTVTDNKGATAFSDATVTVNDPNAAPAANAGPAQNITLPVSVATLTGSGTDTDGTIVSYAWTQTGGTAATIASPATATTDINGLTTSGVRTFRLTVTDNLGATGTSDVTVSVNNVPGNTVPLVNAGSPFTILLPSTTATLNGTASDPDGSIASIAWSQVSGTNATIVSPAVLSTQISGLNTTGTRTFRLTVTDNQGAVSFSDVTIIVNPANIAPSANAGTAQTIVLPASSATLTGSGTDSDGSIVSYAWTQTGGTTATITSAGSATTTITGLTTVGVRTFRLTVTDNNGATAFSDVTVTVNPAGAPIPGRIEAEAYSTMNGVQTETTADAGGGLNVGWIDNGDWMDYNVGVTGTANYLVKFRVSSPYTGLQLQLKKQDGTLLATLAIPQTGGWQSWTTISTVVTLNAGTQTIRVASLGSGWNFNWMDFTVNGGNVPPTANAGASQTITLPASSVTLNGTGTDTDGTITKYAWSQFSGPGTATIATPAAASTAVSGLIQGTYVFRLTVTDNNLATATADVTITVNASLVPVSVTTNAPQSVNVTSVSLTSATTGSNAIASRSWTKFWVPGQTIKRLTIIGSSTSAGYAASVNDSAYASKLKAYYKSQGIIDTVYNLAVSGTSVFDADITTALNKGAQVLLVNYPSNGYTGTTYSVPQICARYQEIADSCQARGVQFYTTGTQPRNDYSPDDRLKLNVINDSLKLRFGSRFIDFLKPVLNTTDNTILPEYSAGDGIHENNLGHEAFYQLVKAANIFQNTISSSAVITSPQAQNTTVTSLPAGISKFQIAVIDSKGLAASALAQVTVIGTLNAAPVARAGADQVISLPASSVTLSGTASTDDHNIIAYQWTKISGTGGILTTPAAATTTFTGLSAGTYIVELKVTDDSSAVSRDTVVITVNSSFPIPGHIEAESYNSQTGIQTEVTSDAGGGLNVGWIDNGDWMDYNVNVQAAGTYTVSFRVASPNTGRTLQIKKGTTILTTVTIPNTGGWQNWQTVSASVTLTAGVQTLRIYANSSGWNFNWVDFLAPAAPRMNAGSGGAVDVTTPASAISDGQGALRIFPNPVKDVLQVNVNNQLSGNVTIEILTANGEIVRVCQFSKASGYFLRSIPVSDLPKGTYLLHVRMNGWSQSREFIR